LRARKAILPDAEQIHALIGLYSEDGTLLPRTLAEICENVRDFVVVEQPRHPATRDRGPGESGRIMACGALHLYGTHLAEVRSIAVHPEFQGRGAGRRVVKALLAEAARQRVSCVCLFTRIPQFFAPLGFRLGKREELPDKIYKDCLNCPRLHACDEIAMVRGELPQFAILEPKDSDYASLIRLSSAPPSCGTCP